MCTARLFSQGVDLFALKCCLDRIVPINLSWDKKTGDIGLSDGEGCIPLRSLVLTQYRGVIDKETDRR